MSNSAYVMNYRNGVVRPMSLDAICAIFNPCETMWSDDRQRLTVRFSSPDESVEIFFGKGAVSHGNVNGLTIERPIRHSEFLNRMYQLLRLDNVMIFYSDETTPVFHRKSDPAEYPRDLLIELGTPRYADCPNDLLPRSYVIDDL